MQSANLGLNDSHESEVVHYLRFARSKRGEALKAVADAFGGVVESRLLEDTYTSEEVKELLGSIEDVIRADIETELIYSSHTNVLLLKQVFEQAEKWHLSLQTNISELENRYAQLQLANSVLIVNYPLHALWRALMCVVIPNLPSQRYPTKYIVSLLPCHIVGKCSGLTDVAIYTHT